MKTLISLLICLIILISPIVGRPQLTLTVLDEPLTTPRTHPPSPEDLEDRRQLLVNALSSPVGVGGQVQSLQEIGLDLVGGIFQNSASVLEPLRNATMKAREGLPRLGNVINRAVDGARAYRKQIGNTLRESTSSAVNNGIRIFTTASARASQIIGGLLRFFRTLLDNLTFSITRLAQTVGKGIQRISTSGTRFLAVNVERARKFFQNPRLTQPAKDLSRLASQTVMGLASDFSQAQSWVADGVKTKITLGNALVPRVRLTSILGPSLEQEKPSQGPPKPESEGEISEGGYNAKRDSSDNSKEEEAPGVDILDILNAAASDVKEKESDTTMAKVTSIPTSKPTTKETNENNEIEKESKTSTAATKEKSESLENLFGLSS